MNLINNLLGGHCLGRPGRGASQVEKSSRLNWATQFLSVAYDGSCSRNFSVRIAWICFGALPCKKKKPWKLASSCCWNRARRLTCFLSAFVTRKDLQFGTWTDPFSNDTIDCVLRHREVGRAKDLTATLVFMFFFSPTLGSLTHGDLSFSSWIRLQ